MPTTQISCKHLAVSSADETPITIAIIENLLPNSKPTAHIKIKHSESNFTHLQNAQSFSFHIYRFKN